MKFSGGPGHAPAVKVAVVLAIAATGAVVAAELAITAGANAASQGRHVNHQAFVVYDGRAATAPQPAGGVANPSESGAAAGRADAQSSLNTSDTTRDTRKVAPPPTSWFTEPNDPPIVAVQTKYVPKP